MNEHLGNGGERKMNMYPENPQSLPRVNPIKPKKKIHWSGYLILGIVIGVALTLIVVEFGLSDRYISQDTLDNQTITAYQIGVFDGQVYTANYTTMTSNFTYIENDMLKVRSINEHCAFLIQNLNNQEVK